MNPLKNINGHLVMRLMRECPGLVMVHPHRHRLSLDKLSIQQDVPLLAGSPTTAATLAPLLTLWPNRPRCCRAPRGLNTAAVALLRRQRTVARARGAVQASRHTQKSSLMNPFLDFMLSWHRTTPASLLSECDYH